jgi:AraC-like DNA-binding protein
MGVNWGQGQAEELSREAVPAVYAAQLVELAARFHVERGELLEGTGIAEELLDQPEARVSSLAIATLASRALHLTREPGLGYYFGLHLKLSSHGSVGLAAMTAATLGDAIRIAQRYVGLRDPHLVLEHYIEGDLAVLELVDMLPPNLPLHVFTTEALCTAFSQIGRSLLGRPLSGLVDMAFAEPPYFQGFAHLLPGAVRFNQGKNRLLFPRSLLDESLQMSDPVAARQALSQCEAELARLGETSSLLATIRRELRATESFPSLEEVAERQRVSARTLKRRLAAHGTSFRQLTDELRRDRALVLLENRELTVERIAELLGYSDASNFQRAFRRWLGVSPAAFRESHVRAKR